MNRRRAFTLFEVLVSIGLIVVLVAAMSAFLQDALRIRARVSETLARGVTAEAVVAELERALETCVVDDAALGTGVRGGPREIEVLRAGLSSWRLGSAEPRRAFEPVERVGIEFRESRNRVAIVRGDSNASELPGELFRVQFRYLDDGTWVDRFNSGERGRLPGAVEIAIWFTEPRGAPIAAERPETDEDIVELTTESLPDRRRVIAIPDSASDSAEARP
ncbi:MAG: prepilin-type N-terminal cleavage/methylation domain-containing protein [Phycisphaerae bacterium]|nr:prepilin-type N-terminal cleavage/methylation domain-containing protein [Phycisphaerae bacterium]